MSSNPVVPVHSVDNVIQYCLRQRGNPLLGYIKNAAMELKEDLVPDYLLGTSTCALYLSLRYHLLHPDYLIRRIEEVGRDYRLRVILCHVDLEDNTKALREVNKTACRSECTLILAWSLCEAARYLETYKAFENKSACLIRERVDSDFLPKLTNILTTVKSINKSDVLTLANTFGSLNRIMSASIEELSLCPGLGERKVKRIFEAFNEPFIASKAQASKGETEKE